MKTARTLAAALALATALTAVAPGEAAAWPDCKVSWHPVCKLFG